MRPRSTEDIENELKAVNEIIHSKKLLLDEFSDDLGLKISIKTFEGRKKELLRELEDTKKEDFEDIRTIKTELRNIQELLAKSRELITLNPEEELFGIDMKNLEDVERHLTSKLIDYYLNQNVSIYELKLTGKYLQEFRMPIVQLGEVLNEFQNLISSIFSYRSYHKKPGYVKETLQSVLTDDTIIPEKEEKKQDESKIDMLSESMVSTPNLYTFGMLTGSVRLILSTPVPSLDNTALNDTFSVLKDIINCGIDMDALQIQITKIGDPTPIKDYTKFLSIIFKNNMDFEFSGKTKELKNFKIFKLNHEEAKNIHDTLNKKVKPLTTDITKVGMFRALDLERKTFKFKDDSDEVIPGKFEKELLSEMEDKNFHEIYKVKIEASISMNKLKKDQKTKYELKKFLE